MPQDALMLKNIAKELNNLLAGGKINKVVQPNTDSLVLTVYNGKIFRLFISVDPTAPRINFLTEEIQSPLTAPNFCMLLRKHLLSATIKKIELALFDRIIKITLSSSQEFFDAKDKVLYLELMGRYSNVILTEDGKVLGANRGANIFDNGVRPLIVNKPYVLPPVGEKREPKDLSLIEVFSSYEGEKNTEKLGAFISSNVLGLAQTTAREIAYRFNEKYSQNSPKNFGEELFYFINDFIDNATVKPCVTLENDEVLDVLCLDYNTIRGERKYYDSLLEADNEYFTKKSYQKTFRAKKDRLTSVINAQNKKINKRLTAILSRKKDALDAEDNKLKGELILANVYLAKKGDEVLIANNYYDGTTIKIPLNPDLSPSQNASNYYKKYNKQKRALSSLIEQENIARDELEYLSAIMEEINLCESLNELLFIEEEMKTYGLIKTNAPKNKKPKEIKHKTYIIHGYEVVCGRNNVENDKITLSAKPNDLWLHAKTFHSSHVIIKNPTGAQIFDEVIKISAEICAYYSKARESGNTEIVYTKKRCVKKTPNSKPGSFIYTDFNSIVVKPNKHDEFLKN